MCPDPCDCFFLDPGTQLLPFPPRLCAAVWLMFADPNLIIAQRSPFYVRAPFTVGSFCFGESLDEKRGERTGKKMRVE